MNYLLEYSLDAINLIAIYNDQGYFTCQSKDYPNDTLTIKTPSYYTKKKNFVKFRRLKFCWGKVFAYVKTALW